MASSDALVQSGALGAQRVLDAQRALGACKTLQQATPIELRSNLGRPALGMCQCRGRQNIFHSALSSPLGLSLGGEMGVWEAEPMETHWPYCRAKVSGGYQLSVQ